MPPGLVLPLAASPELGVTALRSAPELDAIIPEWEALWRRVPTATPFQHPAWLVPWWQAFAHGELWTIAIWRGEQLSAVLPLYREQDDRLLPLGVGISDWLDALVEPDLPLAPALAELPAWTGCSCLELPRLAQSAFLYKMPTPSGAREEVVHDEPCPGLVLPSRIEELGAVLPQPQLRQLQRSKSRAERVGSPKLCAATVDTARELLEHLIGLHTARWSERGEDGVLADPAVVVFHRAAVLTLARAGLLRMYALMVAGRIAAVYYGLGDGRRAYGYLIGFAPELSFLSPGALVIAHAIEEAVREGATEFDFLRGQEPYKYKWGAVDRPSWVRRLTWSAPCGQFRS
jgi:CelD/BcsL family acetyltransferase involved in cellulose biosynthesis